MSRVIKQTVLTCIVAITSLAFAACGSKTSGGTGSGAGSPAAASDVAATVNNKNIMLSEVDKYISQQYQGQPELSPLERAQARLATLDSLIQKEVLFQRADKEGLLPKDEEVTQLLTELKQQSGMTEEEFQKKLKEQGQTEEMLREEARKQKAIEKLQNQINAKITVRDEEVLDYYNNNKQQFVNPRGVAIANIVVDPGDNNLQDDAKNDTEAKVKIDNIYTQLKGGADFATVARARSEDVPEIRARGGDLGFATEDALKQNGFPPALIEQLFGPMQVGSYTPPVQFPNKRWYIFKLQNKHLQTENLTFDSQGVRQQIIQALTDQRKAILNNALLEVAMSEAKIVNNLAGDMLAKPELMSGMRQSPPSASPAASPSPAASAAATPQASASPAASASPKK